MINVHQLEKSHKEYFSEQILLADSQSFLQPGRKLSAFLLSSVVLAFLFLFLYK